MHKRPVIDHLAERAIGAFTGASPAALGFGGI
jgi:hypothetical protein